MIFSLKYWNDCADPLDMEALWENPDVCNEWINAGECRGKKVHLSRDPDGQPYLTQIEMKAVASIIVNRYFKSQLQPEMICAIAELASNRRPLLMQYDKKKKQSMIGIMQLFPATTEWLVRDLGYRIYGVEGHPDALYRPFVSVYFGAAYLWWLSTFDQRVRTEEFVVRAYNGGTKKANHKSTLPYWKRYLAVKEALTHRNSRVEEPPGSTPYIPKRKVATRSENPKQDRG